MTTTITPMTEAARRGWTLVDLWYSGRQPFPQTRRMNPPLRALWFGTNREGQDVWSRVVYGARPALQVGLGAVLLSVALAAVLALAAGYLRLLADRDEFRRTAKAGQDLRISVDSCGQQSDELGAQRGIRRRPCKPA